MSTITDSLKNFYKKLGGSLSNLGPNSTSADIVDAMAEVYTDKEGTHVEVTEEVTEGTKIATITTNNEAHDIYAPAGVGGVDVIRATRTGNNVSFSDGTPAEIGARISQDIAEGKIVQIYVAMFDMVFAFNLTLTTTNQSAFNFQCAYRTGSSTRYTSFQVPTTGTKTTVAITEVTVNDPT